MTFFSTIIDFSYLRKIDCQNKKPSFDLVQEMWQENLSYRDSVESFEGLAYPFTNNDKFTFNKFKSEKDFSNRVKENIIFFNDITETYFLNSEIILLNNNGNFEIDINLKYNESLSKIRNEIIKGNNYNNENINKNILFIYVDSFSH